MWYIPALCLVVVSVVCWAMLREVRADHADANKTIRDLIQLQSANKTAEIAALGGAMEAAAKSITAPYQELGGVESGAAQVPVARQMNTIGEIDDSPDYEDPTDDVIPDRRPDGVSLPRIDPATLRILGIGDN